jgi:hypothetical protein
MDRFIAAAPLISALLIAIARILHHYNEKALA